MINKEEKYRKEVLNLLEKVIIIPHDDIDLFDIIKDNFIKESGITDKEAFLKRLLENE